MSGQKMLESVDKSYVKSIRMYDGELHLKCKKNLTDEQLLNYLKEFHNENGRPPTQVDFTNNSNYPSYDTYKNRFGSWNNAVKKAGFIPDRLTEEELFYYIRKFYDDNGRIPKKRDFIGNPMYPRPEKYVNRFGNWEIAIRLSGCIKQDEFSNNDLSILSKNDVITNRYSESYTEYKNVIRKIGRIPFYINPYCQQYMPEHVKSYVEHIFGYDIEHLPYRGRNMNRSIDWILNWGGERLKVKCITSSASSNTYKFYVRYNDNVDAFLLIAIKDRLTLEPDYIWLVKSKDVIKVKKTYKQFWDRMRFDVNCIIDKKDMVKYELTEKLVQLKSVIKMNYHRPECSDDNVQQLLIEKQKYLFEKTGIKRKIEYIIEDAIELGLENDSENISDDDIILKMKKRRLRKEKGIQKGLSPKEYENDAYCIIVEKQKEIFVSTGNKRSIEEIVEAAIILGLNKLD